MSDPEIVKMLFEVHHGQMEEKRTKIHNITERTIGLLVVVAGWLIVSEHTPGGGMRLSIVLGVIAISVIACIIQYRNNRAYMQIASVIQKLNQRLGVYDIGRFVQDKALYPDAWKEFGRQNSVRTIWHHWLFICIVALVCIVAALSKN
jgi:hypothetical protein